VNASGIKFFGLISKPLLHQIFDLFVKASLRGPNKWKSDAGQGCRENVEAFPTPVFEVIL